MPKFRTIVTPRATVLTLDVSRRATPGSGAHLPFRCAKTVSELDLFEPLGLLVELEQIPQNCCKC